MKHFAVDEAVIEYEVYGTGEPVLLIHISLIPDGLARPLIAEPDLASQYQIIHYYRRGYMGSTQVGGPPTMAQQVSDASALLKHLGVKTAHIAGHSYGGLITLQLALDAPDLVRSIVLLEPPLRMVPSGEASFKENVFPMLEAYRSGNKQKAAEVFSDRVFGPNWQSEVERAVPGGVQQAVGYMDLFIQEQPVIRDWQFGPKEAASIRKPVLSVVGLHSNRFMKEVRELLHAWIPHTEDCDVNSTHLLQMQDAGGVARGMAAFFARHPIAGISR